MNERLEFASAGRSIILNNFGGSKSLIANNSSSSLATLLVNGTISNPANSATLILGWNKQRTKYAREYVVDGGGTVSLLKTGSGIWFLSGTNTYSGVTNISGGTLEIGNGGTLGLIVSNVVNGSLLAFNRSDSLTYGGTISGAGGVAILTGTGSFYGGSVLWRRNIDLSVVQSDSLVHQAALLPAT